MVPAPIVTAACVALALGACTASRDRNEAAEAASATGTARIDDSLEGTIADARDRRDTALVSASSLAREAARQGGGTALQSELALQRAREVAAEFRDLQAKDTARGLVVSFGDVLFEAAQPDLRAAARPSLENLSAYLRRNPQRTVQIEGYPGSAASSGYELELAASRAGAVRDALLRSGIAKDRIEMLAPNSGGIPAEPMRRVDVIVVPPDAVAATYPVRDRTSSSAA